MTIIPSYLALLIVLSAGCVAAAAVILALLSFTRFRKIDKMYRGLQVRLARLESVIDEMGLTGMQLDDTEPEDLPSAGDAGEEEYPPHVPSADMGTGVPQGPDTYSESMEICLEGGETEPARSLPQPVEATEPWWAGLEESIGKRWTVWVGALALFISAGFFLKYAFDNEWLGPTGRIVLGIVAGGVLLVTGDQTLRRRMRALGQGLMGGGLAILYVSLFVAFSLYDIIPQIPAFGAMVVVTAAGMTLAVLHNAVSLSFLALLGGLLTPLMVSTGQDARDSLFTYLVVLDLGVLGVAVFKRWRALDLLAFLGTWALFAGWFFTFYRVGALLPTLMWVSAFFLIFLILPFVYQLRLGTASSVESFVMALSNAVISFAFAYWILHEDYQFVLGFAALVMAACYVVLAALLRRRVPGDARTLFGFVGLAVVLVTLAVPLHLKLHGITMAWAVEGPVLVYLGYLYHYRPVRIAGFIVLVLSVLRLFFAHWPFHHQMFALFLNRYFAAAMVVPAAAAVYALIHHRKKDSATGIDRYLMYAAALGSAYLALVILSAEVSLVVRVQGHNRQNALASLLPLRCRCGSGQLEQPVFWSRHCGHAQTRRSTEESRR